MRTLTASLLAAQKTASSLPYMQVKAYNLDHGVVRYQWTRLYTGSETGSLYAAAMPGDGSLVRARVTPPADAAKLYYQRVANPGTGSDFATWTYSSQYGVLAVAAAALGAEVSIFWIQYDLAIYRIKSTNYGATWGSPELIGYATTPSVYGMAAAYKPDGDAAIFFADQITLYVQKCVGGTWQSRVAWGKTTGDLSGVAKAVNVLGIVAVDRRQFEAATLYLTRCLELGRASGDRVRVASALNNLGEVARKQGDLAPAVPGRAERLSEIFELRRQEVEQVLAGHTRRRIAQDLSTQLVGGRWISLWVVRGGSGHFRH